MVEKCPFHPHYIHRTIPSDHNSSVAYCRHCWTIWVHTQDKIKAQVERDASGDMTRATADRLIEEAATFKKETGEKLDTAREERDAAMVRRGIKPMDRS